MGSKYKNDMSFRQHGRSVDLLKASMSIGCDYCGRDDCWEECVEYEY